MRIFIRFLSLLLILTPLLTAQTPDQIKAELDRDEADVIAYRLSMDALKKVLKSQRNLVDVLKADPALAQRIREKSQAMAKQQPEFANGRIAITPNQKMMESEPKIVGAFQSAGITVREAMIAPATLAIYALARFSAQSGGAPQVQGLLPENLAFLQQNEAALKELGAEMQKVGADLQALAGLEEDDEDETDAGKKPTSGKKK